MKKEFIAMSIACTTLISGCATPFRDYEGTANRVALANICEREGHISKEAFASYASFQFGEYASQWTVDRAQLQSMYLTEVERTAKWRPSTARETEQLRLNCAEISTVAMRVSPKARATQQEPAPIYKINPVQTTNCMTTYGWTRCTTN